MFNTTKKITLAAAVSLLALSTASFAAEPPTLSEIDVSASYNAAEDTNAAELFPEIAEDVQIAIAKLVPMSDSAGDPTLRVDIRKVALNGDTMLPDSAEFNELEGVVSFQTRTGEEGQSFPVNIKAVMDDSAIPEGYAAVPPSLDDYYRAMVDGFAMKVAERIGSVDIDGNMVTK
ncbi:hypothetical protein Z945_1884 [Sulfitobacter noctilucae]|uniref:hypothetical protein n=1 Tax=Sulfitobacter noctilucae TaxID=1342302 RepID=UPI000469DAA5|nr:hypothetical protein [Sulfitobacter noctilucae]KIN60901.1 hypothetical protein Z945_1884 [Sulfitobacter noctilucae]